MSSIGYYVVSGQQTEYIYKKTLGIGYEKPGRDPQSETLSSLPYIFNNQIIPNNIPLKAPLLVSSINVVNGDANSGTKFTTSDPNIVFYEYLPLKGNFNSAYQAFLYDVNDPDLNLTTLAIPSTYDPGGSYNIKVYARKQNGDFTQVLTTDTTSWIFDNATGCLTFTNVTWNETYTSPNYDVFPYISFYRYVGDVGLGSSSQWVTTTNGNNIYYNTGNVGIGTNDPGYTLDVIGTTQFNSFPVCSSSSSPEQNQLVNKSYVDTAISDASGSLLLSTNQWNESNTFKTNTYLATTSGNVGIGKASAQYTLDVSGTIKVSGNVGIGKDPAYTYALDVSGSAQISNNNLNVAGNNYVYTPYSVGAPFAPQIVDITSTSAATQITFTWSIPTSNASISTSLKTINATLYANISGNIQSYQILTNVSINITTLNKIIVTNQPSNVGFNGTTTYTYYNSELISMNKEPNTNNQLILWYTNYSPYPNVSYKGYAPFSSIGVPSEVLFTQASISSANVNSSFHVSNGSITLNSSVAYIDKTTSQTIGPPYIKAYQIPAYNYYSSNGSSTRYSQAISDAGNSTSLTLTLNDPGTNANVNSSFEISDMYPDSSYIFSVKAKNSSNSNYGELGTYNYSTPAPSYPTDTFKTPLILFDSTNKKYTTNGYFVGTNSVVSSDIINYNTIGSGFVSNNIITAVQQTGVYGINSLSDSSLNVIADIGSTDASVNVLSFGHPTEFSNNTGGISVQANTFDAYYNGPEYNQGFYLDCSTNMTITPSYLNVYYPTPNLFTARLTCTGNNVIIPTPTSSYSFYADKINSQPSYNSIGAFTINPNNNYYSNQVSGIWVLHNSTNTSPYFSINNLSLSIMGTYFYASPLVTYKIANTSIYETDTTHINSGINTNGADSSFNQTIEFTNSNVGSITISDNYDVSMNLSITAKNLFGTASSPNISKINVICDTPSYKLIATLLAQSIQTVSGSSGTSPVKGYRVWSANVDSGVPSGTMNPSGIVPYIFIIPNSTIPNNTSTGSATSPNNEEGYINIPYNNVWDILSNTVTNQELLVANGKFTTNSNYYLNYGTDFSGNGNLNSGYDYRQLSNTGNFGKKYATFAWNASNIESGTYKYLNFVINFSATIHFSSTESIWYLNSAFSDLLELYYRFEYKTDVNKWGTDPNNTNNIYPSTTWITINKQFGIFYNSNDITNKDNAQKVYNRGGNLVVSSSEQTFTGNVTFKTPMPSVFLNAENISTLYLRIGVPSGYDAFSDVKSYISIS
jgi:hypothetical protein